MTIKDFEYLSLLTEGDRRFNNVYARVRKSVKGIKNNILLTCNPTGFNFFYDNWLKDVKKEKTE